MYRSAARPHRLAVRRRRAGASRRDAGQSLIESCIVLALICLIFFGLLQVSLLAASREILFHSAARAARAKTVGFDWWMCHKAARVAVIPNSGRILEPVFDNEDEELRALVANANPGEIWDAVLGRDIQPNSEQARIELARIPFFMGSANRQRARQILHYEHWESNTIHVATDSAGDFDDSIRATVEQENYRLWVPFARAFVENGSVDLRGHAEIESHYGLYINDMGW